MATVVNIIVLGREPATKPFDIQARDLKKIIALFNPREVVIDTNGLGKPQCPNKTFLTAGKSKLPLAA